MKIKSYCINLKRAPERKIQFEENWREILGVELEYFVAVDGRCTVGNKAMSNTELACLRSHLSLMRKALKTTYDFFLIFEDDAIPQFTNMLEAIELAYQAKECDILICCLRKHVSDQVRKLLNIGEDDFIVLDNLVEKYSEGACAIFYTRKGLKDYINHFGKEEYKADWFMTMPKDVKIYITIPPLVDHLNNDSYISSNYGRTFIK